MPSLVQNLSNRWRYWRRAAKAAMPYVRRREYRILRERHAALARSFLESEPASLARLRICQPLAVRPGELCLFVTHAPQPQLKPHVRWHVEQFLDAGVQVLLIANADAAAADAFGVDADLAPRLAGCIVRENVGFDFAAWAQVIGRLEGLDSLERLILVNDSIVGPLDRSAFVRLMQRVRAARADVLGLTENPWPVPHLQSFFLVFQRTALASPAWRSVWPRVLSLPTKEQVIDAYEMHLTRFLREAGLVAEAMFPSFATDPFSVNDTYRCWHELIEAGFPYVKTRVLADFAGDRRLKQLLPAGLQP